MNGKSKIEKWLKNRGYHMTFVQSDMYSHCNGFHKGELYFMEVYRTSLGYYIIFKHSGRPWYGLCETTDIHSCVMLNFSQREFIKGLDEEGYFPVNN